MILGISGSMNEDEDSCINAMTYTVLQATEQDTELIFLKNYNIKQCGDCQGCNLTGDCMIIEDDMKEIRKKIEESEALLFAEKMSLSPVSGMLANFMNRCYPYYWSEELGQKIKGKRTAAILSCNYASKELMKGNFSFDRTCEERAALRYMEFMEDFCNRLGFNMVGGVYATGTNPEYKRAELIQLGKKLVL